MHQEPREKIMREVTLPETITIQELAQRMSERAVDVIKYLMKQGQMMKPGDVIDADTAELIAVRIRSHRQARLRVRRRGRPVRRRRPKEGVWSRVRRSSPSWAMSTTARPRCSTRSASQCRVAAKPAASPSISAPIRSRRTARRSPSSTRPATPPSRRCAPAARRPPTSPCWWWPPTTA
jgi:hypothetical protein